MQQFIRERVEVLRLLLNIKVPYPWKELNDMTFGIRWGEMVAIGGGVGSWSY